MDVYDIRRTQLVELEILKEFDRVCKKNNLDYFLDSGTALGAVRHKGFIPWDDDIDVGMMRNDYDMFLEYGYKDLDEKYFFQTRKTDKNFPGMFAKIRKNNTMYIENNKKGLKMNNGIWIDIFPYDYITGDLREQKRILKRMKLFSILFSLKKIPHKYLNTGGNNIIYSCKSAIRNLLHLIMQIVPDEVLISILETEIEKNKYESEYVTEYEPMAMNSKGKSSPVVFRKEDIFPTKKIVFEECIFNCVHNEHAYLSSMFGDYMTLPPDEERHGHRPLFVSYGE